MKRAIWLTVVIGASFMLGGCSETKSMLGLNKNIPDEFAVYSRAPLSLPPDYALPPPEPGTSRPQRVMPSDQAREALSGGKQRSQPTKQVAALGGGGVQALLKDAGAQQTDPDIRVLINRESSLLAEEGKDFTDAILFWKNADPTDVVVDPAKEAKRIQDAKAMGTPLNEGEIPTISRGTERSLFKDIF